MPTTDLEIKHGPDRASASSASPVTLTAAQKEKISSAIVQSILDETKSPPQAWMQWHFGQGR